MKFHAIIDDRLDKLYKLCEQFKVSKLYAFGSVVTDRFDEETSDIDLIVELSPMIPLEKGETLLSLWNAFEELFGRKVDLLSDQPIANRFLRESIEKTKQLIYDRKSEKVFI